MAVILGYVLLFTAGVVGAYFVGASTARSRMPAVPARSPSSKGNTETRNSPQGAVVAAVPASEQTAASGSTFSNSTDGEYSKHRKPAAPIAEYGDLRRFKRLAFSGTALATIYPYPEKQQSTCEPKCCEVLTRDLSCGGVGIAHTESLVPHQTVVLDAAGKLLIAEVRWCQRVDKGLYIAGCRLIKTKT
jgi:hypothetical protein